MPCATTAIILLNVRLPGRRISVTAQEQAASVPVRTDADVCDEKYRDMGTNDFLIGLMERHEKMAWMLRAFLAG